MTLAPPAGGRSLYCPCGSIWANVSGPRPVLDHAACLLHRLGIDRIPCLRCGQPIAAVPSSSEAHR